MWFGQRLHHTNIEMIYLNQENLLEIGVNWNETIETIEHAVNAIGNNNYAQPLKPYLRYGDPKNRIIAMPAFVGEKIDKAGIKWIASFPDNIEKGIPRANSVVILNNSDTGEVEAIINTALLSVIRTASVTGMMIKHFKKIRNIKNVNVGIIGFGPIGKYHFEMCNSLLEHNVSNYYLYDKKPIIDSSVLKEKTNANIIVCEDWKEVYDNSDIFITCTVADKPYIEGQPKKGALLLNISLRDYKDDVYEFVKNSIIVDDWEEVCREKTTVENWYLTWGLKEEDVKTICDVLKDEELAKYSEEDNIMFNPMGMAVFDVAIGDYYLNKALENGIGTQLI